MFWIAPSSAPRKAVWSLSWPTSWEQQIVVKNVVNCLSRHVMGLGGFCDTLSTIILHFGGDPAMDTIAVRFFWSAAAAAFSPTLPFDNRL
jgi:hypothetical protein